MTKQAIEKGVTQNTEARPNGTDNHAKGHPTMNYIAFHQIPETLKDFNNWVAWKLIDGKKIPINPDTGEWVSSTNPEQWATYTTVEKAYKGGKYDGIGFMFSNSPVVGIDIDDCIKNGVVCQTAKEIITGIDSYTELSPSGSGVHILLMGKDIKGLKATAKRLQALNITDCKAIEMYSTERYFTVTGHLYDNDPNHRMIMPILGKQEQYFNELYQKLSQAQIEHQPDTVELPTVSDPEALERAKKSPKFEKLWNGDISAYNNDHSAADMALMDILAIATRKNAEQMGRLFSQSALAQRKKGKRADYIQRTIDRAIKDTVIMEEKEKKRIQWPMATEKGNPKNHIKNLIALSKKLNVEIKYNAFTHTVEISSDFINPKLSIEAIITKLQGKCLEAGWSINYNNLERLVNLMAEENQYNPVQDWLKESTEYYKSLETKPDYLEEIWQRITLDRNLTTEEKELCHNLFVKWLVNAYVLAFNELEKNYNANGMLIFISPKQGIGKTRFIQHLMPVPQWCTVGLTLNSLKNKDEVMRFTNSFIVEIGELNATLTLKNVDEMKSFLTAPYDEFRRPYARESQKFPRHTIAYGTVNEFEILKDTTGNRRYWPISVEAFDYTSPVDYRMLWGQIGYMATVEKVPYWLDQKEIEALNAYNSKYMYMTDEEMILLNGLNWDTPEDTWEWKTVKAIATNADDTGFLSRHIRNTGKVLTTCRHFRANGQPLEKKRTKQGYLYKVPKLAIPTYGNTI